MTVDNGRSRGGHSPAFCPPVISSLDLRPMTKNHPVVANVDRALRKSGGDAGRCVRSREIPSITVRKKSADGSDSDQEIPTRADLRGTPYR